MQRRFRPRRRVCEFCADKNKVLDYKDVKEMQKYVSDHGKILPRRATGTCAKHQRKVAKQVKRARIVALLPFVGE